MGECLEPWLNGRSKRESPLQSCRSGGHRVKLGGAPMVDKPDTARTDNGMEHFGYRESLDRGIGKFGSFAAGVSYISILTGTFQLFYFGFGTAGPAYLWSWPMVLLGQLAVALCFMELAAKYPVAGSSTIGQNSWAAVS